MNVYQTVSLDVAESPDSIQRNIHGKGWHEQIQVQQWLYEITILKLQDKSCPY